MTGTKTAMSVGSLAFVMLFGGGVFLMMNLGNIAKNIAEKVASETLGVKVTIAAVKVDVKNLAVGVKNIRVGNPPGYKGAHALKVEQVFLKAQSLSDVLLHFDTVQVSGTHVYLEVKPDRTNLTDIKKTVDSKAAKGDQAAKQVKVIIENMNIDQIQVHPSVVLLDSTALKAIDVPPFILKGIGKKENGILAKEAVVQIWEGLMPHIEKSASGAGFYQGVSSDALKDLGLSQAESVKQKVKDEINNLGRSLGGIFGD